MKKLLLSLLLTLPLCGFAQKGMQGVGVSFGSGQDFSYGMNAPKFGVNYQQYRTDRLKIAYSFEYYEAAFDYDYYYEYEYEFFSLLGVDVNYFLNDVRRFRPYGVGGLRFGFGGTYSDSWLIGGVKLGIGFDYRLGYHWTAQFELPLYIADYVGCFIPTFGIAYNF